MTRLSIIRDILTISIITIVFGCSFYKDIRLNTETNTLRITSTTLTLNTHFINGDYIISINDSIGKKIINKFSNLPDSSIFKNDTIDLKLVDQYWTGKYIKRELRKCFEFNQVQIYYISKSKYLHKIQRVVSNSKFKDIHSFYTYKNITNNDTILYSYSFDTGTPPF